MKDFVSTVSNDTLHANGMYHTVCLTPIPSSGWVCYPFGKHSIVWEPAKDQLPNWWVRFWMRVFFGSVWKRKGAL